MRAGYSRWDSEIYAQESLDKNSLHQEWKDHNPQKIAALFEKELTSDLM